MRFKDVIIKNFIGSIGKYLSYFLSGIFCTAMFFMYSTLVLMDDVINSVEEYPMMALMVVTCVIISLFSVFFISYSHGTFVKNKKKELGVYLVLGMDEKLTRKMLGIETALLTGASILSGMLVGTLFARFFQVIVIKLVEIEDHGYRLSIWNYLITIVVFLVIYAFCFIRSDRALKKEDISSILKEKRRKESRKHKRGDILFAVTGFISLIFSVVFILHVAPDNHINSKLWVLCLFLLTGYAGLYLIIVYGGRVIIHAFRGGKHYFRHMLTVSELDYKYNQNIKVILILTMLASMIVLLVGSPIALVSISTSIAEDGNRDIEFMMLDDYDTSAACNLIQKKEVELWDKTSVTYAYDTTGTLKPVLSVSDYNRMMGTSLNVNEGEVYHMITTWIPGTLGVEAGSDYSFFSNNHTFTYKVSESIKGTWIGNNMFKSLSLLLLSDRDYSIIVNELSTSVVNEITFSDGWRDTRDMVASLHAELKDHALMSSRMDTYLELKHGYSVFLFVSCSLCFMFFISTGCVLYFKQYNDIDDEKQQYKRLYRLGISDQSVKRSISAKMAVVYFIPLLGSVMGLAVMYYLASLFGGNTVIDVFMKKGLIGLVCYVVSQTLFYLVLRVRYTHDVVSG